MKVRMKVTISGGRSDGTEWPPSGQPLECDDREGAELCAAGLAEPVAQVEEPAETPEGSEPPAELRAPAPGDLKGAWVTYAVARGMDPDTANGLTKQELIDRTAAG